MKEKLLYNLPSIIFNIFEILVSILIGVLLKLEVEDIVLIILLFNLLRNITHSSIHYKDFRLCFLWTILFYSSLFLTIKVGLVTSLICTTFSALILTNKGNIVNAFKDVTEWGGNVLNKSVFDWVKFNQNNELLIEYENNLRKTDKRKYYIFVYRFKEFKSYSEIAKLMNIDAQRVSDEIKIISHFIEYSIRLNTHIEEGE
jgi:predicted DNA-binding protein YlxM (UPF0122 family)